MKKIPASEKRTPEQLREHYELEKKLANRLRNSTREERRHLYSEVCDELYSSIPHHPRHTRLTSAKEVDRRVQAALRKVRPHLFPEAVFMEIGPGDCRSVCEVAKHVKKAYGFEVSTAVARPEHPPANFEFVVYDGTSLPLPPASVDLAFSESVMEHLHPDDAFDQLQSIAATLKPGGKYIFNTPHQFTGPRDISRYFDEVATGFHLKEYTFAELAALLKNVGFRRLRVATPFGPVPIGLSLVAERILAPLPYRMRHWVSRTRLARILMDIRIIATR